MMSNSSYKYSFSKGVFFIFVLYVLTQITAYAASINVTQAPEGDLIVSPPFTWSTSYINDGETNLGNGYNWLSKQQDMSNTFEFVYDGNLDGSTGEEGDSNDIYHLDSISLYVPNSDRALKEFTLFSQSNNGPWKQLFSSQALPTPYNFARTSAGGIRTVNPPSSSWSPDYINDGNTSLRDGYNWLSKQQDMSNTFEFTFDPDLDGSAGETNEQFTLDSISVYVPSSDRALREFTLFSQSNNGPWQQLFSSQALPSSYNFAKTSAGGVRAVNPPSSSWSPDYINDGNTSLRDGYNWLSKQRDMSNIFEFTFDPDLDGSTGEANEQFTLDSISVYVPNSDRALKDFEITVQTTSGWQPAIALQAAKQLGDQTFSIGPINNVLRVRLTTSSNYGDVYQQINEFEINGVWSGDNPIFVTSQLTGEQRFDLSSNPTNNDGRRESITRLKLETSSNHGGSYQQINEFEINGIWSGDNPIFVASQLTGEQRFDLSSNPTNNDGRRESITRLKLETSSNHGGSYQQINEFQAFGSFGGIVPIASWHMDEDSWNSITDEVIDATDNNYHGTAINGTTTEMLDSAITGNPGSCGYAQFDGSNDYIDLPDLPNLTSSFTLTAWVKSTSSKRGRIFADDDNNQGGYALSLNEPRSGRLRFYSRSINPVSLDTRSVVLPPNKHWYFVTTVHDANTKQRFIYVNGTLEASGTYTGTWGTDTGHASIGSETNASKEGVGFAAFEGNIDEVQVFESALTQSQIQVIMAETHPCEVITDASNFNCVATNTNAITGRLYTQIENHPFTLDVAALQDSTTLAAGFSNTVTVELVNASSASDCASYQALDPALEQSLSFTSITGIQTTASISSEKAYRNLKCRVTDTTSSSLVVGCSADSFAIRPQGFTLSSPLNSTSHTGSQTKKAGITFDITAKTDTLNYDGSPVFNSAKITAHNNAVQTGTLSGDFPAADFTTGNATGSNFTYNEVGIINLDSYAVIDNDFTAIDKAAGDCVSGGSNTADASGKFGCTIGNEASLTIGRFIPDHFEVST
ncbi:MAG: hypothetical protein GQ547_04910, partial [Methylophaga sp.]|nr:hypothetical protein [Methylophaga sp.]